MKLENQIVSLELAKRLKELGCKQDSIFKWHSKLDEKGNRVYTEIVYLPIKQMEQDYSAFTVAELGELLPKDYYSQFNGDQWMCLKPPYSQVFPDQNSHREEILYWGVARTRSPCLCPTQLLKNNLGKLP